MPTNKKIAIQIEGMTCQTCANRIEKVLNKKPFVQQAGVNFAAEEALVEFDSSAASEQDILTIIQKAGFSGKVKTDAIEAPQKVAKVSLRLWLLLAINLVFLVGMAGMLLGRHDWMLPPLWQLVLAGIVQFGLAWPFYRSAIGSLRGGMANMDVLVSIGTLTIYGYSAYMLFTRDAMHVYFEASVMVIGFVSLGKFLEDRTKKQSLNSLGLLLQLTPNQVNVQRDGLWQLRSLDSVAVGDVLRANHGERIAADGEVIQGSGWCDESHLTGESLPLQKVPGSQVLAGALVSEGSLIYRAHQLGRQTLLGDMMHALSEAQGTKAPIARFADKVAGVFVPTVLLLSFITFLLTLWFVQDVTTAVIHAVAVLVIACPCALGLATPAAIMVGMGKAVNAGIWFKDAASLEESAHVNCVVLDKTGTLTKGELTVAAVWQAQDYSLDADTLYRLAASVEQTANHPLARAIVQAAQARGLTLASAENVQSLAGEGVAADIAGVGRIKVGSAAFCGLTLPTDLPSIWSIASIVAVAVNDRPIGAFALADSLKEDSRQAITRLQQANIEVVVMSGDQQSVVDHIAQQLGIKQAFGHLSPRDKAARIAELKAQGKIVAMVGDGINDAPALAMANVSFAMKGGADVAQQTASATLMQHSVNQLADALVIARATLKNIRQNLFFALIYNVLGIPLAALGFLTPVLAGAAMAMSSVSVLMNALRLKRVKIR
ncbi:heavy metal translocating P-type ATPase [Haemophilus pittmaniae]|uniref:heavy metal translocating P-type ATPase n=1 Tax=Haemophilus pittmaniae TaxID=249188 RepID=UPI000B948639|nr:heavy metal translocating P-type ATPase [Haemophilus pittmaniae]SNV71278.1 copper transporter [Haemophilus pittmaniae]